MKLLHEKQEMYNSIEGHRLASKDKTGIIIKETPRLKNTILTS